MEVSVKVAALVALFEPMEIGVQTTVSQEDSLHLPAAPNPSVRQDFCLKAIRSAPQSATKQCEKSANGDTLTKPLKEEFLQKSSEMLMVCEVKQINKMTYVSVCMCYSLVLFLTSSWILQKENGFVIPIIPYDMSKVDKYTQESVSHNLKQIFTYLNVTGAEYGIVTVSFLTHRPC